MANTRRTATYFVDEAGDLTFFDRRGNLLLGGDGVSRVFIVAAALIADVDELGRRLEALRSELLSDQYFAGVPSMSPERGRTARLFHAKDDLPEVRREVLRILMPADVEVFVAFRRKREVAAYLRAYFERTRQKLGAEFIYDELVTSVFENRLHLAGENHIVFARRGKANRNVALNNAIALAKRKFDMKWRKGIDRPTTIASSTPSDSAGLQVVDYYL